MAEDRDPVGLTGGSGGGELHADVQGPLEFGLCCCIVPKGTLLLAPRLMAFAVADHTAAAHGQQRGVIFFPYAAAGLPPQWKGTGFSWIPPKRVL